MSVVLVTATSTGVGKTAVTAALASLNPRETAVVKLGQTGVGPTELGDIDVVRQLSGCTAVHEFARYPDPLSPHRAAARSGRPPLRRADAVARVAMLAGTRQLLIVEGSGGVLVPFDETGWTVLDLAADLAAAEIDVLTLVVTAAELGTLNHTALTLRAVQDAGLNLAGVVLGSWPTKPDLAARCNLSDLAAMSGRGRLAGALPAGLPRMSNFSAEANAALGPELGGSFNWSAFAGRYQS